MGEGKKLEPGRKKTGGRIKGVPNKITTDTRELILGALSDVGGRNYLAQQAIDNPPAFLALVGKCLPKDVTVTGADNGPIVSLIKIVALE